jgi:hypothetical protein
VDCEVIDIWEQLKREEYKSLVARFRPVSDEYCQRYKLCMTSGKGGKVRCAKKASFYYDSLVQKGRRIYICCACHFMVMGHTEIEMKEIEVGK